MVRQLETDDTRYSKPDSRWAFLACQCMVHDGSKSMSKARLSLLEGVSFERLATPPPQQQSVPEGDKNNMSVGRYSRDSLSQPENYCNGPPGSACRSQGMVAFWKFWKFYNHLLKPNL